MAAAWSYTPPGRGGEDGRLALLDEALAAEATATFEGEAQWSVVLGTATAGCYGCMMRRGVTRARAEAGMREGAKRAGQASRA